MKWMAIFLVALQIARPRAGEWMKFPAYERTVLPNGVTLLLMENHDAPLIDLSLALRSGSTQDPEGREGLADITNDLLRKGAGPRTAEQISEDLDFIGATLDTTISLEITRVHMNLLVKDLSLGLEIFTDLILRPAFPQEEVEKLVHQRVDEIKASKDQPLQVTGMYFRQFLFGAHPYGRPPGGDEKSVASLTREEIVRFHRDAYVSSNLVLIAVGDFNAAEMKNLLVERFGKMPARQIERRPVPKPEPVSLGRLLLIDKPDATQTFFAIGNTGISIKDPDRIAVQLVNTLFGGRFTSRLNTALRIDSGLSYGARSGFTPALHTGDFYVFSYTRNDSTAEALDAALQVLRTLHKDGISAEELASGKAYIKGQFGPSLETPADLAARLAQFEVYGLDPAAEVDQYAARLDAVTVEDARRVIERFFPRTNLVFAVIGKGSAIEPKMKNYSPTVRTISISQPGFGRLE